MEGTQKPANADNADLSAKGANLAGLMDAAYVFMGLDGRIIESNASLETMLGYSHKELIDHVFFEKWATPGMGSALADSVISDRVVRGFTTDILRKDGSSMRASINAQLVLSHGDYNRGIECIVTDISASGDQEKFDETLRNVTGGIAHLINNQMASVVGTADLMRMELQDRPELAAKLDRIAESGLQASDVAHNLVDYADSGEHEAAQDIDLNDIIMDKIKTYKQQVHASKPRNIRLNLTHDINPMRGNFRQVAKVFSYMFDNAIDATKNDGLIIIASQNLLIQNEKTGLNQKHIMFSIEDNGHGMDKDTQHRIFDPFFSTRFAGRGMSLAHALKIVQKHKGRIRVKTGAGKGSVFSVYLPVSGNQ